MFLKLDYCFCSSLSLSFLREVSVRNSSRQSANAEAFAEAYLHFIVFAWAIKMPRQLEI